MPRLRPRSPTLTAPSIDCFDFRSTQLNWPQLAVPKTLPWPLQRLLLRPEQMRLLGCSFRPLQVGSHLQTRMHQLPCLQPSPFAFVVRPHSDLQSCCYYLRDFECHLRVAEAEVALRHELLQWPRRQRASRYLDSCSSSCLKCLNQHHQQCVG